MWALPKPPLTVQNAAITTASVEIKTLTVSGKQVTLAVFRQLLDKPLIRDDGTFAGQPWGTVNYHPDKCANDPAHWHVVWQEGDQLRRAAVTEKPVFDDFWPDEGDPFITAWVFEFACTDRPWGGYPTKLLQDLTTGDPWATLETALGVPVLVGLDEPARATAAACMEVVRVQRHLRALGGKEPELWLTRQMRDARDRVSTTTEALEKVVDELAGIDELHDEFMAAVSREHERRQRHKAARAAISQLPQLFIAV